MSLKAHVIYWCLLYGRHCVRTSGTVVTWTDRVPVKLADLWTQEDTETKIYEIL